jgi:NAD-dependent DNA ligase
MFQEEKIIDREAFFVYVNAQGVVDKYHLINTISSGDYLQGVSLESNTRYKIFRKDRVLKMFSSVGSLKYFIIDDEILLAGKDLISKRKGSSHSHNKLEICFTGFAKAEKESLIDKATAAGMQVRDGVAKNLHFLCCGYNAGPKKIESAREKGVLIIVASQFSHMIETGEIPIDQS